MVVEYVPAPRKDFSDEAAKPGEDADVPRLPTSVPEALEEVEGVIEPQYAAPQGYDETPHLLIDSVLAGQQPAVNPKGPANGQPQSKY